jgi:predicted RNase H-like HicB family nuclease
VICFQTSCPKNLLRLADVGIWLYHFNMFTAVYRKCGKWWAAYVEEVPGVNTQGATLAEARANLKEALALILETNRELAREQERDSGCIREPVSVDS